MKHVLTFLIIINTSIVFSQNPYIGKWISYDVKSFKKKDSIPQSISNINSYIIFNSDLSFEKYHEGKITLGRYCFKKNKLKFFEKEKDGTYFKSWSIRWPRKTNDPIPRTPLVDICYPELFIINNEYYEWDVYYKKL